MPDLARDLVLDRVLHEPERVDVLELGARAEPVLAAQADRHVRVAAQLALLHVGLGDVEPAHEPVQRAHELGGLLGAGQLGRGDDLDERHARAVEIDVRDRADVGVLARVLLEVDALQLHALDRAAEDQIEVAVLAQRLVVLRDLIALGQVGIEVVLAREPRLRADLRAGRDAEPERELERARG